MNFPLTIQYRTDGNFSHFTDADGAHVDAEVVRDAVNAAAKMVEQVGYLLQSLPPMEEKTMSHNDSDPDCGLPGCNAKRCRQALAAWREVVQ